MIVTLRFRKDGGLELAVSKVDMFSPAAKVQATKTSFYFLTLFRSVGCSSFPQAGMQPGTTLVRVNDWQIEAMQKIEVGNICVCFSLPQLMVWCPQTALSIILAAGFSVHMAWVATTDTLCNSNGWGNLEIL